MMMKIYLNVKDKKENDINSADAKPAIVLLRWFLFVMIVILGKFIFL